MIRAAFLALALIASPAAAQVVSAPSSSVDATARSAAAAAQAKADAAATPSSVTSAISAVQATIPTAATSMPPAVSDGGATGTQTTVFALANHTHASKARRAIFTSAADGSYTWTFPSAFSAAPVCVAVAEVASGVTDVINVQIIGTPTTTSATFLVNRANRSVASLLGLTVLSIPSQPGATKVHAICIEP